MKTTYQSESGKLLSIIIKPAAHAMRSEDQIQAEWKALNFLDLPQRDQSLKEYDRFETLIRQSGTSVHHLPIDPSLTMDSMYCRDASILTDHGAILCRMGKPARAEEPDAIGRFYQSIGLPILGHIEPPGTVEGGDVAWLNPTTLAVGHSYRTNPEGIRQLKSMLEPFGIEIFVTSLPHFRGPQDVFHLMSILSPVDQNLAVVYAPLMPIDLRDKFHELGYQFVEVPEMEFNRIGCNVLALAPRVCLMVEGHPVIQERLESAGCTVLTYPGDEISIKGGGGPTCLTRPLIRQIT